MMAILIVATFLDLFTTIFNGLILLRIVLGIFMKPENRLLIGLVNVTEPLLAPIRRLMPKSGQFDFSPTVTILLLYTLDYIVNSLLPTAS
jgi:YggT family protein